MEPKNPEVFSSLRLPLMSIYSVSTLTSGIFLCKLWASLDGSSPEQGFSEVATATVPRARFEAGRYDDCPFRKVGAWLPRQQLGLSKMEECGDFVCVFFFFLRISVPAL